MNFKKIIISIVAFVFIFAVIVFAQAKINLSKIPKTKSAHKSGPARSKEAYDKMIAANDIYVDGITGATWKALLEDAFTKLTPAK
ncbi:MAG: FMN-binding protein [Brachyspira sp.]|nr:FMN-binding protein [Brachyspira sp.]